MVSHRSFQVLKLLPVIGVSVIFLVGLVIMLIIYLCGECATKTLTKSAEKIASAVLGDLIKTRRDGKYYIGHEDNTISPGMFIVLFSYAVVLMIFAVVTFNELFVFGTSFVCTDYFLSFCFLENDTSAERISNCTTVDGEDVICYRFIFDFVTAAGVTGGIFTLIQFLTKSVNCSVIRYIHTTDAESKIRVSIVVLYVVFLAILAVGLVVFCALGVDSRLNSGTSGSFISYILQYSSLLFAVILGGIVPTVFAAFASTVN